MPTSDAKTQNFDWFDEIYQNADDDVAGVPWQGKVPVFKLRERLANVAPSKLGKRALDVGCGLGRHAEILAAEGFDTTGFDISQTAIDWAQKKHPGSLVRYVKANIFALPADWHGGFNLVHESYTLQSLPVDLVSEACRHLASLLAPGGLMIVMCRARDASQQADGPPWPLERSQLDAFVSAGLTETHFEEFFDQSANSIRHFLVEYRKPDA